MTTSLQLILQNDLAEIDHASGKCEVFAEDHGVDKATIRSCKVVFDEILNNIISYGYEDQGEHEIGILVNLSSGRLVVQITDDGIPFNPLGTDPPDVTASLGDRKIGGLGVHLIRSMMDEVSYRRHVNTNVVTFAKLIGNERATEAPAESDTADADGPS